MTSLALTSLNPNDSSWLVACLFFPSFQSRRKESSDVL